MDKKHLQHSILESAYNSKQWISVMEEYFGARNFLVQPKPISLPANDFADAAFELGSFHTADERLVGIYEVKLNPKAWIERNRVGLRSLLRQVYKYDVDAALIVFVQADKWRFSYVSEIRTEEGKKETEPKRYTYLFGKNETCRTAADRFEKLKGKPVYLNDLFEAFSVEKLNKDFFKQYKEHYEKFYTWLNNSRYRQSVFHLPLVDDAESTKHTEKPLRDFVKLLLGRIVFLHFLQKKGWMGCPVATNEKGKNIWNNGDHRFLQNLFANYAEQELFHSKCLSQLFFETLNNNQRENHIFPITNTRVPYLNGGLFDNDAPETKRIDFPSEYFHNLLEFFEQYNFTIDENSPDDHEVGIDPEMLGHIFENLLEDNKDKGAFYTPKEIVQYMCQESLMQYLKTHSLATNGNENDERSLERFIRFQEISPWVQSKAREINRLLDDVKICDPAIGSGAFPMGLLQEIYKVKLHLFPYLKLSLRFIPAEIKRAIIQNSIYGVDIEKGAVDIARLRFWLALVVDETEPQPLPNLDYKIMQGNSLMEQFEGIDLSKAAMFDELAVETFTPDMFKEQNMPFGFSPENRASIKQLIDEYFKEEKKDAKEKMHKAIDHIVLEHIDKSLEGYENQLLIEIATYVQQFRNKTSGLTRKQKELYKEKSKEQKEIEKRNILLKQKGDARKKLVALEKTFERPYFLWHLFFGDVFKNGGFDIVIGNPPYGAVFSTEDKKHFQQQYESAKTIPEKQKGSLDSFSIFIDAGICLCNSNATLSYIVPLAVTSSEAMAGLHNMIFRTCETVKISTYSNRPHKIFESADQRVAIIILKKNDKPVKEIYTTKVNKRYQNVSIQEMMDNLQYVNSKPFLLRGRIPKVGSNIELNILSKLFAIETKLSNLFDEKGKAVYYRAAGGRYYNVVTNFKSGSTQEKEIRIKTSYQNLIGAVLSSNLYFWFLHIFSDTLHIKSYELEVFPVPIENFTSRDILIIEKTYKEYLNDLEKNARIIKADYNNISSFKEYRARKSKHFIDKIDLAIKDAYGLSDEEINFIINYDIKFRTDDEGESK
ncbi:MAG: N-6 DNA methylase [Bacteroidota bacterium]